MLRYNLTGWLISSHVGSLFKLWLFAYGIFTTVTRLAIPLRLILVTKTGRGLSLRLAQFREQWNIIRVRVVHASNYLPKRILHGAYSVHYPHDVDTPVCFFISSQRQHNFGLDICSIYGAQWLSLGSYVQPFHSQEWSMSNFLCTLSRNITSHSMKNLAFHSSLIMWKMIILPILATSLTHFLFKMLGECTFWTWEWKG